MSALTTRAYADNESQDTRLVISNAEGSTGLPFLTRSHIGKCVNNQTPLIAYAIQERAVSENITNGPQGKGYQPDIAYTLEARHHVQAVAFRTAGDGAAYEEGDIVAPLTVRRLTPRETERLMGFPDDWTLIPWRKKPAEQCPDGPRYKAIGNSMAVPCMSWIGKRLLAVNGDLN